MSGEKTSNGNYAIFDRNVAAGLNCPIAVHYYFRALEKTDRLAAEAFAYDVRHLARFLGFSLMMANRSHDADVAIVSDLFRFFLTRLWHFRFPSKGGAA